MPFLRRSDLLNSNQKLIVMTKFTSVLKGIIILTLALVTIQCSEDDTLSGSGTVKMDGKSFSISAATMIGVSIDEDGHTAISLFSINGSKTNTLTIDVESFTKATIEGEYAYPAVSDKKLLDDWLTNYAIFDGDTQTSESLESGEVSITHNGDNNYTVDMNLTMLDGVTFIGSYTGDFEVMFNNN